MIHPDAKTIFNNQNNCIMLSDKEQDMACPEGKNTDTNVRNQKKGTNLRVKQVNIKANNLHLENNLSIRQASQPHPQKAIPIGH